MQRIPFVLFGATGDLARKMLLPALLSLGRTAKRYRLEVIGVASTKLDDEEFRDYVRTALTKVERFTSAEIDEFIGRLSYISGDYSDANLFSELAKRVSFEERPIFYLAIPPAMFETVVGQLGKAGYADHGRVMVEKPFGRNREEAIELSRVLAGTFRHDQVYRIDHFLGKEAVQNLLVFRFANSILEPLWNRNYISRIELTMSEAFGVEGRGSFYDSVGVIRDVVQNHLLQLLCLLLMEPPNSLEAADIAQERLKVLKAMGSMSPERTVLAQYGGYIDEEGVAPDSTTPTYAAARVDVNSWRWAGVPVYIRAGKGMERTFTQAVVEFRSPPTMIFDSADTAHQPPPNQIIFHFKPDGLIEFMMQAKVPGPMLRSRQVTLEVASAKDPSRGEDAYAQLIDDVVRDDHSRFATEESVETGWRVVSSLLDRASSATYPIGSKGPESANRLVAEFGGWCS